jgi:hypothetical protein
MNSATLGFARPVLSAISAVFVVSALITVACVSGVARI